jgi:hypothetical protein
VLHLDGDIDCAKRTIQIVSIDQNMKRVRYPLSLILVYKAEIHNYEFTSDATEVLCTISYLCV